MILGNNVNGEVITLENDLRVSVDWLSFTTKELDIDNVIEFLGFGASDFSDMAHGGMGYKCMRKLDGYPVQILFDGQEDMGIHVSISGSAISEVVNKFSDYQEDFTFYKYNIIEFLAQIKQIGTITRIDLAIDDIGTNYFSCPELADIFIKGQTVAKFRKWKHITENELASGETTGETIYLGSRKSDIFLRIYDKKLEQNKKEEKIDFDWVRWELELKDERANQVVNRLICDEDIGQVTFGVLSNYLRLIHKDNNNKSRCSTLEKWQKFIMDISKLSLYMPPCKKTLEDKENWIVTQCMPTLAGVIVARNGSLDIITDNFNSYLERMSRDMKDIVLKYNPSFEYERI